MFVPCPHCGFLVALSAGDEADRQPCPRCGRQLEEEGAAGPAGAPVASPPTDPAAEPRSNPSSRHVAGRRGRASTPAFARKRAADRPRPRALPWLAVAVLAVALALQLFLSQRQQLAADAGSRPLVTAVCPVLGCTVPPWREPAAWTMLARDVVPSSTEPGTLDVTAAFRNQARWVQPLPVLALSLTDRHGRVVAARAFTPDEYLEGGAHPVVPSGEATQVHFRVREPETGIVAFSFEFR